MYVKSFTFNPFQTNCYICHDAGEAVIIDPSCHTEAERQQVLNHLDAHDLTVRHLLLTHGHIDHIFGCKAFAEHFGMSWQMHRADVPMLKRSQEQAMLFGVPLEQPPMPETFLDEGDTIAFGEVTWDVLYTPGHSRGSICFHDVRGDFVIAGDVLFAGSIGRTDLPGGSMPELMRSIFQKLIPLGDSTQVYPGHGPATTIGHERQSNPFLVDRVTG
ncbi:MAG TPA: MBL fold metallo-hydrolase [Rhodothermales bacterium]|nr:MBL fold metallo-hydrolase [Rhodothermales bacterium]